MVNQSLACKSLSIGSGRVLMEGPMPTAPSFPMHSPAPVRVTPLSYTSTMSNAFGTPVLHPSSPTNSGSPRLMDFCPAILLASSTKLLLNQKYCMQCCQQYCWFSNNATNMASKIYFHPGSISPRDSEVVCGSFLFVRILWPEKKPWHDDGSPPLIYQL